jgi:outer membrane protein insertion porin family
MFSRRARLLALLFCSTLSIPVIVSAQQATPQPAPAKPKPANPFETVPQSQEPAPPKPEPAKPGQIQLERPQTAEPSKAVAPADVIADIEFRGSRRVPQDTLRALIFSKKGDRYNEEALHRDFMALWNTSRFDDIRLEREATDQGWLVRFLLTERRVIRSIKYEGAKSITVSEILDRFKERKVGLSVESQYDPNKVQRATNVLKEFLSERGRQFATVEPEIRQIPPSSLEVVFMVKEGLREIRFSTTAPYAAPCAISGLSASRIPFCSRISSRRASIRASSRWMRK